jgi:hypothetical protein
VLGANVKTRGRNIGHYKTVIEELERSSSSSITPNSVAAGRGSMSSDNTLNFDIK